MSIAALSTLEREATLDRLEREAFDCLVIGGGITGAGIAREAAQRGLRVALLDARDYASGTSSRSSKLIHGGLRYLAMGDVALVRSTALERKVIHRLAPHLAEPRWLVVPARSRAGLVKLRAAITTYEKLGAVEPADLHHNWSREEIAREEPLLRSERTPFACVYREYLTDDARLVLANLRAAVSAGAVAASYAPVTEIFLEGERAAGVVAECQGSGRRIRVRARAVINAAGPWVDPVRRMEAPGVEPRLLLSKGVHIVLPGERLALRHMLILNTRDKRSVFVIPRDDVVYVGTTDTVYRGTQVDWPEIEEADVRYLLEPVNRDLDVEPLGPGDVGAAWAGVRPLIAEAGKAPSEISRKDEVWIGPHGVVTIAGGKLTGYRLMAREAVEAAARSAGIELAAAPPEDVPLPGGDFEGGVEELARRIARETGLAQPQAARLAGLYGSEAVAVARRGPEPLVPGGAVLAGEVDFALEVDGALHLEDVLYRRTRAALYAPAERDALVEPAAARMGERLGWDPERRAAECAATRARLAADLAFRTESRA